VNGYCDNTTRLCVCDSGFTGSSCNITGNRGHWIQHSSKGQGRHGILNNLHVHQQAIGLASDHMYIHSVELS